MLFNVCVYCWMDSNRFGVRNNMKGFSNGIWGSNSEKRKGSLSSLLIGKGHVRITILNSILMLVYSVLLIMANLVCHCFKIF